MKKELIITNVSALVDTGVQFNLFEISQKVSNSSYNPKRLHAVIIKKTSPKCTLLIFKSGKIMALGTESEKDAQISMKKTCKEIQKICMLKIKKFDFRITNVFGTAQFDFQIDLPKLCDLGGGIKTDSFPGVVYTMKENIKAATIYYSGKITLIGGKSKTDLEKALIYLEKKLKSFMKPKDFINKSDQNKKISLRKQQYSSIVSKSRSKQIKQMLDYSPCENKFQNPEETFAQNDEIEDEI